MSPTNKVSVRTKIRRESTCVYSQCGSLVERSFRNNSTSVSSSGRSSIILHY